MKYEKKTLIIALLAVVAVMGIGFSILSNHLKIQGTVNVDDSFDVEIVGIKKVNYRPAFGIGASASEAYHSGEARELANPTYTATTATFNVSMGLESSIIYLVTIENKGSMAAEMKDLVIGKTGNPDIEVRLPIDIRNRVLGIGEKAYILVDLYYPYKEDLSGTDGEVTVEFDAKQTTSETDYDYVMRPYIAIPGFQYSQTISYPIEILGLEGNNLGSPTLRYTLYESIDDGEYEETLSYELHGSKYEVFYGIEYHPEYEQGPVAGSDPVPRLQDGETHTIKLKLHDVKTGLDSNEITLNYNSSWN